MKKSFFYLFFFPLPLFANTSHWVVTTWGNGKTMKQIFDAVASLFSNAMYQTYLQFGIFCGLISLLLLVAWKADLFTEAKRWLIPTFCFLSFGLMPVTVVIEDKLALTDINTMRIQPVDNVPLFIAAPISLLTGIAGEITDLTETVYHKANDAIYNWTGHIYAGHSIYNTRKMRILDGTTEQNFREFCRECVFRDLGIGLYTRQELLEAPNLIQFLKENTSKIRGCNYIYPKKLSLKLAKAAKSKKKNEKPQGQLIEINKNKEIQPGTKGRLSCHRAIHYIAMNIAGNLLNQKEILLGAIGNQFSFLSGQAKNAPIGRVIEQQIAIDTIRDYTNPTHMSLAASKARLVQNETNRFLGLFSAVDLMELRNTFTLILIALSPFLGVISLMQLGFGMMLSYIKLLGWLSSWPPFYVVINFLLDHKWMEKKALYGISSQEFTLASSEALFEIWKQQQSLANSLLCWVPPLSWAVLFLAKQGVHALVSMMGGLGAAAQGAASAAATESVTGTQSYRNVNTDSRSTGQTSFFQQQRSPFFSQGALTSQDASGKTTSDLMGNRMTYAQNISQLSVAPQMKKALSKSLSKQISEAESLHKGNTTALNGTVSDLVSMMRDIGFGRQTTLNQTEGHTHNVQKGLMSQAQKVKNQMEAYAKQRGISIQDVFKASIGAGLGVAGGELGFNYNDLTDDQKQQRIAEDLGLFKQLQKLSQTARTDGVNLSGNSDASLAMKFTDKFDKLMTISDGYKVSHSRLKALKEMESVNQSNELSATKNLINPFVDYALARSGGDIGRFQEAIQDQAKMDQYMAEFLSGYEPQLKIDRSPLLTGAFKGPDLKGEYEQEQSEMIDHFNRPGDSQVTLFEHTGTDLKPTAGWKKEALKTRRILEDSSCYIGEKGAGIFHHLFDPKLQALLNARRVQPVDFSDKEKGEIEGIQGEATVLETKYDANGKKILDGRFDQAKDQFEGKYGTESSSFTKRATTAFVKEVLSGTEKERKDNVKEFMSVGDRENLWNLHKKIKEANRLNKQAERDRKQGFSLWDHAADQWETDSTRAKVARQAMMNLFRGESEEK